MDVRPLGMLMWPRRPSMFSPDEIQSLAVKKSKGKRPKYLGEDSADHLLSMIMVLAEELAVSRERADTLERLLEAHGMLSRDEIERYIPSEDVGVERQLNHSEFISRLLRSVRHEVDALSGDNQSTEEIVDFLKKN